MDIKGIESAVHLLIKFGSKQNIQKLQSGQFYMKRLKYYVDLEKNTSDEMVGDQYDGQMMLKDVKFTLYTCDTNEYVGQLHAPISSFNLGYLNNPVFCMYMLDYRNYLSKEIHDGLLHIKYGFSKEQSTKIKDFGESALVVTNTNEFFKRIENTFKKRGIDYFRDLVSYYDYNNIQQLKEIQANNPRIAFWKRQKYAFQQEYRFFAHTEVEDNLTLDIGDVSDISQVLPTEQLLNTYLEAKCTLKEVE
ncbi:MAG: hypothetical protein IKB67_03445 [Clostridia bacterium]|nr:hypothetical protein [Clostridia bacterium]